MILPKIHEDRDVVDREIQGVEVTVTYKPRGFTLDILPIGSIFVFHGKTWTKARSKDPFRELSHLGFTRPVRESGAMELPTESTPVDEVYVKRFGIYTWISSELYQDTLDSLLLDARKERELKIPEKKASTGKREITLTENEGQALRAVVGRVGGDPELSRRGYIDSIMAKLHEAGFDDWKGDDIPNSQMIYFSDRP